MRETRTDGWPTDGPNQHKTEINRFDEPVWGDGYCPHAFMDRFRCSKCGSVHFKCYPQTVPTDRSKTWTWEYVCAKCGQGMGLTVLGDKDE